MVPCLLVTGFYEPITQGNTSLEMVSECLQEPSLDRLPADEKQVYHQLGPLYQKIYLQVLNDEERHRVVVYIHRGLNGFDAINIILRSEERKYVRSQNDHYVVPSDRACKSTPSSRTTQENL